MKITKFDFPGLMMIELKAHVDSRGHFVERWNKQRFLDLDLPEFLQDNFSRSGANVVRGLHYQYDRPQGKLITCLRGKILDVLVDLRPSSSTYGQHCSFELSGELPGELSGGGSTWLWIPPGFAHGFSVLSDDGADVWYKVDQDYNSKGEGGIRWDDPTLAIDWRVREPHLSNRDRELPTFIEYSLQPNF